MEGYIKLFRQIEDSEQFADPITLKIWIWCLIRASHKDRVVPQERGNRTVISKLLKGQFIFGRNTASESLNIHPSSIYRHMQKLEAMGAISIESNKSNSVITICNYDSYQSSEEVFEQQANNKRTTSEQQANNKRTTSEQQANTNKNDNNYKNVEECKEGEERIEPPRHLEPYTGNKIDEFEKECIEHSEMWLSQIAKTLELPSVEEAKFWVAKYFQEMRARDEIKLSLKDTRSHCFNWAKIEIQKEKDRVTKQQATQQPLKGKELFDKIMNIQMD